MGYANPTDFEPVGKSAVADPSDFEVVAKPADPSDFEVVPKADPSDFDVVQSPPAAQTSPDSSAPVVQLSPQSNGDDRQAMLKTARETGRPIIFKDGVPTLGDIPETQKNGGLVYGIEKGLGTAAEKVLGGAARFGEILTTGQVPAFRKFADESAKASAYANSPDFKQVVGETDSRSERVGTGLGGAAALLSGGGLPGALGIVGTQAVATGYDKGFQEAKNAGKSEEDARQSAQVGAFKSAVKTVPELAAYWLLGLGAAKAVSPLFKQASPLVKGLVGGAAATAANVGASTTLHAINNEPLFTPEGFAQDATFGFLAHGLNEGANAVHDEAQVAHQLGYAPDEALMAAASDPNFRNSAPYDPRLIDKELSSRNLPAGPGAGELALENAKKATSDAPPANVSQDIIEDLIRARNNLINHDTHSDIIGEINKQLGAFSPEQISAAEETAKQPEVRTTPPTVEATPVAEVSPQKPLTTFQKLQQAQTEAGVSPEVAPEASLEPAAAQETPTGEGKSIGPGAASSAEDISNTVPSTSLKRAVVDLQRKAEGREYISVPERASNAQLIGDAEDAITNNPEIGSQVVDRILRTPEDDHQVSKKDAAIMLLESTRLRNERAAMEERAVDPDADQQTRDDARYSLTTIEDRIDKLDNAIRSTGTAWSDYGRLKQLVMKDDYSLEALERKAIGSKAKHGEPPMTRKEFKEQFPEEHAKLQEQAKRLAELEKQSAPAKADYERAVEDSKIQETHDAIVTEDQKGKPQYGKEVFDIARKVVDRWKTEAQSAHADLQKALGNTLAGVPNPAIVLHVAKILRAKIGEFGLDKAEAFTEMVAEYGPKVKEHLENGWTKAHQLIAGEKDSKAKQVAKKGIGKKGDKTTTEAAAAVKAEKVVGDKLSQKAIVDYVRSLINGGEHDTNALMAKTHSAMKEQFPDTTERDVRRAFVDYGKKTFPSKEAVEVEIRENKQFVKIQEDIDREMEGLRGVVDPETGDLMGSKTQGYQRDKATQRVRDKIKERNELLKKRKGPDTPEKLASTQARRRTQLENAIADTDRELKTGVKQNKPAGVSDDAYNEQLRAELKAMRDKVKEIDAEKNPGKSEAERQEESLQKQLDDANAELAGTKQKTAPREWKALSQKAEDLRAQLDSVRQLKKELSASGGKTASEKQIDQLSKTRDRLGDTLSGKRPANAPKDWNPLSAAAEDIKAEIQGMQELAAQLKRDAKPASDPGAKAEQAKIKALEKSIKDYEERVAKGDFSGKGKPNGPDSATVAGLKAIRDARRAAYEAARDAGKPIRTPEERYNDARIKVATKQLVERQAYLDQIKNTGKVPPKPSPVVRTKFAALAKIEADLTATRREVKETIRKLAYDNRSTPAKIKEGVVHALKLVTSVKVLGHGTVGMFTHAGGLAWRPTVAEIFWSNFGKQFKLWTSKAYHDQAIYKLKSDPDFETWKNAGASIDPEQTYTDYGLYAKWMGKLGEGGTRGFDALKLTRLELNKATWDKVPASVKSDPVAAAETRNAIADINNKATGAIPRVSPVTPEGSPNRITNGVYNLAKNPLADAVFFAPKLYASRWARVVLDPVKTIGTLADWNNASVADKTAAKIRMKNAGQFAAVYVGALLINKGLLQATGSDQDVNITDPTKPDWLKFKGAGKEIVADGGLLDPVRLLGQVVVGDIINLRTKNQQYREGTRYQKITEDLGKYARSKFNPTLGLVVDATTGTDYAGKPLPFSSEPPKFKDQGKYTWPEWLMQQGPIPVSQGVKVAYDEMRKNGMSHAQAMHILKGAAVAAVGATGVHVTEDHPNRTQSTPKARR